MIDGLSYRHATYDIYVQYVWYMYDVRPIYMIYIWDWIYVNRLNTLHQITYVYLCLIWSLVKALKSPQAMKK